MTTNQNDASAEAIGQDDKATQFFKLARDMRLKELLPEWEISVIEAGNLDKWEHYHPRAATEEDARQAALDEASGEFTSPMVDTVLLGPYAPSYENRDLIEKVLTHE